MIVNTGDNNIFKFISVIFSEMLSNNKIFKIIAGLLYLLSCFSCLFDYLKTSQSTIISLFFHCNSVAFRISDLSFFWLEFFCFFIVLYSKECKSVGYMILSALLMTAVLLLNKINSMIFLSEWHLYFLLVFMLIVPIVLLTFFEKIEKKLQDKDIHNV